MKHPRGKSYDPEFKLRLAKEFAETDKTLEEIAQENGKHKNGVGGCGFVVGKSTLNQQKLPREAGLASTDALQCIASSEAAPPSPTMLALYLLTGCKNRVLKGRKSNLFAQSHYSVLCAVQS